MKGNALAILVVLALVSCTENANTSAFRVPLAPQAPIPQRELPPADGFDFPVGPPDAKGYYNAQGFTKNNHLGDDWNGNGGGNSDKGDPVFATADGLVKLAMDYEGGWGKVIRILHNAGTAERPYFVESLYAHLDSMHVEAGAKVKRGQKIGNIGDAGGAYWAHLHFEIRRDTALDLGGGYDPDTTGYLDPTKFVKAHRPKH